jgi:uncharacterized protein
MSHPPRAGRWAALSGAVVLALVVAASAQSLPRLTAPVNDFARVIDPNAAAEMDRRIRVLQQTTGDAVYVVTVQTFAPYGSIEEYATRLFEREGIGQKNKDNGLLIVLALNEHRVRIEVGYGLEQYVTDGFSGETIREVMLPEFRANRYGQGLLAGSTRVIQRIADGRGVTLPNVPRVQQADRTTGGGLPTGLITFIVILIVFAILRNMFGGGGPRGGIRRGRWGGPWSGWSGGLGGFGGGFGGGGFGGFGGGGGGFGGLGGGRSGGGGATGGW